MDRMRTMLRKEWTHMWYFDRRICLVTSISQILYAVVDNRVKTPIDNFNFQGAMDSRIRIPEEQVDLKLVKRLYYVMCYY